MSLVALDIMWWHYLFGCTSGTVSYARELTSVSMCYLQGDGFNTSLSNRLLPDSDPL